MSQELTIRLPEPHSKQAEFVHCKAKRIVVRAGRRGGKTYGMGIRAVERFLAGRRVLYATPTQDQIGRFWSVICQALEEPIKAGIFRKNETQHFIERPGTEQRIRAKTAWNADTLRGDYADDLILDEWQLMNEDAWELVGAPMLADHDGDAVFIYTPPSLRSRSTSKANDPQHAAKLYRKAQDRAPRWATFHFTSHDNPFVSAQALEELSGDMSALAYRMEIQAEDVDEVPGALWSRELVESCRVIKPPDAFEQVVVAIDPSASSTGDEAGIITAGKASEHGYLLEDNSIQGTPKAWATAAVAAFHRHKANRVVAEANNGGEMISLTIHTVDPNIPVKLVHASRGKQTRAEPVAALYEHGKVHHVGSFTALEDEMCLWTPGDASPNRMDAAVWAFTYLLVHHREWKMI